MAENSRPQAGGEQAALQSCSEEDAAGKLTPSTSIANVDSSDSESNVNKWPEQQAKKRSNSYKQWMWDPTSKVPRQTAHRWRTTVKPAESACGSSSDNIHDHDGAIEMMNVNVDDYDDDDDQVNANCVANFSSPLTSDHEEQDGNTMDDYGHDGDYDYDLPDVNEVEDHESEDEDDQDVVDKVISHDDDQQSIYPGARITVAVSTLLIITFVVRHGLSGVGLLDLLSLVEIHMLSDNVFRTSVRLFRQYLENNNSAPTEQHYFCEKCIKYLATDSMTCNKCKEKASHFVVSPLSGALQNFFSRDGFLDLLRYPLKRQHDPDNIEDVFDGSIYKERFGDDGFILGTSETAKQNEVHISFQMNTDGVALFKSAKSSVWPVYLVINELHPKLRFSREYRILCGMWFGASKPNFQIFMKPFAQMLADLYTKGTEVTLSSGIKKTVKGLLLSVCMDSPARCQFQNFIQFNGKHGCAYCLSEGKTVKTSEHGSTQTYPYNIDKTNVTGHGEERTHRQTCEFADTAEKNSPPGKKVIPVMGVKGHSVFSCVPRFDIIRCVPPDYMHGSCLGIFKLLLFLWFDVSHRLGRFSIRTFVKNVDERLSMIKPPNLISRPPQKIETHIKWWKASEYRSFFLYYAIPCLYCILPLEYFEHLLLLVNALHILLSKSISKKELKNAKIMLKMFCFKISDLYHPRYNTWNMHSVLHYCNSVEDLGPLSLNSCFWYEDFNGDLRHLFHGTNSVGNQILSAIAINQQIPQLASTLRIGSHEYELYNQMKNKSNRIRIAECISDNVYVVGALGKGNLFLAPVQHTLGHVSKIQCFKRISMNGVVIQSKQYDRVTTRNTFTISFQKGNDIHYGQVVIYVKCNKQCLNPIFCNENCECHQPQFLAIVQELKLVSDFQYCTRMTTNESTISHIKPVSKVPQTLSAVHISSICSPCVWMDVGLKDVALLEFFLTITRKIKWQK